MKRVYCSKCNKETFQDLTDHLRNKGNPICQVHPANDEAAEKTIEKQLKKKTLLIKSRPTREGVTWMVTYSRTSGMNTSSLYPKRHGPFCK